MINLEALTAEVTRAQTVQSSAIKLLKTLTTELEEIGAKLASESADTAPLSDLIDKLKTSTDGLAAAVADSLDKHPINEVVLNADDPTKPTIQVVMPEVLPENVVVSSEVVVDKVDPASSEPQVVITVQEAPAPVAEEPSPAPAEPVVNDVIETAPTQVDVNVTAPASEVAEVQTQVGIDVLEAVQEAVAQAEVPAVEAPVESVVLNSEDPTTPTVQVVMPEVLPENVVVSTEQLVETVDPASPEPQIAVYVEPAPVADPAAPAPAEAPAEAVIETPEGQTNVTVSVPAEVQAEAPAGIDLIETVKEAVAEAEVAAEPVPAADPAVTPAP